MTRTPPQGPLSIGWSTICPPPAASSPKAWREAMPCRVGDDKGKMTFPEPAITAPALRGEHRTIITSGSTHSNVRLNLRPAATRPELDAAMKGHILDRVELMGRFQR